MEPKVALPERMGGPGFAEEQRRDIYQGPVHPAN